MNFSYFISCCWNEEFVPEDNKILMVYTDKTLTHYQKCVLDEKTSAKTVCDTISKTHRLLKGKFGNSSKKHWITEKKSPLVLVLISRENFLRFSQRILNFFEFPLSLKRRKCPEFEYIFVAMSQNELKIAFEERNSPPFEISLLTNLLEKGKTILIKMFDIE